MKRTLAGLLRLAAGSMVFFTTFAFALAAAGAYHLIKKIPMPAFEPLKRKTAKSVA